MTIRVQTAYPPDGPRPTNLRRDLRDIADLIELCFGDQLDSGDLSAVQEMRMLASLGPLLWLLGAVEATGLGLGFVKLNDGRVVGNVNTLRAGSGLSGLGAGWLIANVAVHPDLRRQGIARALMETALDFIRRQGGRWVVLQLEHDNHAARALYESLGFEEVGRLTVWQLGTGRANVQPSAGDALPRPRRADEWQAEMALAARDRVGELAWTRPLEKSHFKSGLLREFWDALNGTRKERWVLDGASGLLGALWVEAVPLRTPRLTLFLDPAVGQTGVGSSLVRFGLGRIGPGRHVRLEAANRDPAFAAALMEMGFQDKRTLVQMRLLID